MDTGAGNDPTNAGSVMAMSRLTTPRYTSCFQFGSFTWYVSIFSKTSEYSSNASCCVRRSSDDEVTLIRKASGHIQMGAGDVQPLAQLVAVRVVLDRVFVVGQRIAPTTLALQQFTLPDDVVDAIDKRFLRDDNLSRGGARCPPGTEQEGENSPRTRQPESSSHRSVHRNLAGGHECRGHIKMSGLQCTAHTTRTGNSHQQSTKGPTRRRRNVGLKRI